MSNKINNNEFKYDVSITMIVKNEERFLERCLQSLQRFRDELSCELIIVDTGSTDGTIEIAEKYADKLIHFEWTGHFAQARNESIKAAEGRWFFIVDGDEVFDDTIQEFIDFMKLPPKQRDAYDNVKLIVRSLTVSEKNKDVYADLVQARLHNITKGKRYYSAAVHAALMLDHSNAFITKTILTHYGYLPEISAKKLPIRRQMMIDSLEKEPNDVRMIYHIIVAFSNDYDKKIEYAKMAINLCKTVKGINRSYEAPTYAALLKVYQIQKNHIEYLEILEDFLKLEISVHTEPYVEILYRTAFVYSEMKDYERAIEYFNKFKSAYEAHQKSGSTIYADMTTYDFNNEKTFFASQIGIIDLQMKDEKEEEAIKTLENATFYNVKIDEDEKYTYIDEYISLCIKLKQFNLLDNVYKLIEDDEEIYVDVKYKTLLIAALISGEDKLKLMEKCLLNTLSEYTRSAFVYLKTRIIMKDLTHKILTSNVEVTDIRMAKFYLTMAELYIINQTNEIKTKQNLKEQKVIGMSIVMDDKEFSEQEEIEKLGDIFEFVIINLKSFMKLKYRPEMLNINNVEILSPLEGLALIMEDAILEKRTNTVKYLQKLKESIKYMPTLADTIKIITQPIQEEIEQIEEDKDEFEQLAQTVKETINTFIKLNNKEQSLAVLEQYKKVNPNDEEIPKLAKLIEEMN